VSPKATKATYARPSFWENFISANKLMYKQNEGLVQRHAYDSRPDDWPLLHRGINYWNRDQRQVYLLGNPIAFWGSAVIACAFLTLNTEAGEFLTPVSSSFIMAQQPSCLLPGSFTGCHFLAKKDNCSCIITCHPSTLQCSF
jgi:hypothetical protein